MSKIASAIMKWHPYVVLLVYAGLISGYRHYLDVQLKYVRPRVPAAPEDVLGFGFWVPWLIMAAWFTVACVLSYRAGLQRKSAYWFSMMLVFVVLSALDLWLYRVLERQVLGG